MKALSAACVFYALAMASSVAAIAQTSAVWLTPSSAIGSWCASVASGGIQGGYVLARDADGRMQHFPTIWNGTAESAINLLPVGRGSTFGEVKGLDGNRQVGWINDLQSGTVAAYWEGTASSFRALALTHPDYIGGRANAIAGDQVVGEASYLRGRGGEHACMWNLATGAWVDLQPANGVFSTARDTDGEYQVGYLYLTGRSQPSAVMWHGSAASAVVLEPPGSRGSECFAVANGTQVGHVQTADLVMRPVVWHGTAASWRDMLPSGYIEGQILGTTGDFHVGWAYRNDFGSTAMLWFGDNPNVNIDLRTLLGPEWGQCVATSITVEGDIATIGGYGRRAGSLFEQGVVWTIRVPTPPTAGLLTLAVAALRRRRSCGGCL